jgi:F0F1-type ATP synthase membrane subunit b/b'
MKLSRVAAMVAVLALLGACQKKDDPSEAGPAERAGRKIDQVTAQAGEKLDGAARQAGEQLSDAARDTSQQVDKAADKASETLNQATRAAGRKLEQAGEKMQTAADERDKRK